MKAFGENQMQPERCISSRIMCKPITTTHRCQISLPVWLGRAEFPFLNYTAFEEIEKPNDTSKAAYAVCSCDPDPPDVGPIIMLSKGVCECTRVPVCCFLRGCADTRTPFVCPTEVVALIKAWRGCRMHGSRVPRSVLTLLNQPEPPANVKHIEYIRPLGLLAGFFLYRNSSIDDFGRILGIEKKQKKQKQITQNKSHSCIRS